MAQRLFIFREGSTELVLPVTPDSYRVESGINIEVVNIHQLGDAILAGYGTLATISVSCLLPARDYAFAGDGDPQSYIQQFTAWVEDKKTLRFIVSDTGVNIPVLLERVSYGERDGTNDVYAELTLREYRQLQAVQSAVAPADNAPREEMKQEPRVDQHEVVSGDTLSAICRKHYNDGSASVYGKVAEYNGIANPHLIFPKQIIYLPQPL